MDRDFVTSVVTCGGELCAGPLFVRSAMLRFQKRLKCGAMDRDSVMRYDLVLILAEGFAIVMLFWMGILSLLCSL